MTEAGVEPIARNADPAEFPRDQARAAKPSEVTRLFMEHLFKVDPNASWN